MNRHNYLNQDRMSREEALAMARLAARELARHEELHEQYGEILGLPDGSVIRFIKEHQHGRFYTYAAVRAAGRWHLTGRIHTGTRFSDDALVDFLEDGIPANHVELLARGYSADTPVWDAMESGAAAQRDEAARARVTGNTGGDPDHPHGYHEAGDYDDVRRPMHEDYAGESSAGWPPQDSDDI
jgi:hypothetical protein